MQTEKHPFSQCLNRIHPSLRSTTGQQTYFSCTFVRIGNLIHHFPPFILNLSCWNKASTRNLIQFHPFLVWVIIIHFPSVIAIRCLLSVGSWDTKNIFLIQFIDKYLDFSLNSPLLETSFFTSNVRGIQIMFL